MGASVDTEGFTAVAEIAVDGFLGYRRDHAAISILLILGDQLNCAIRAITFAETATNAVILNHHFQMIILAVDGIDWTTIHAVRLMAGTTRRGDKKLPEPQPLTQQSAVAIMGIRTSLGAFIAARATFQVKYQ